MAENIARKQGGLFHNAHGIDPASGTLMKTGATSSLGDFKLTTIVLFHLFILCLQSVSCTDITAKCPPVFPENTIEYVECIVNKTVIDAASCVVPPTSMNFGIARPAGATLRVVCNNAPVYPCTSLVSRPTVHGDCACTNVNGNELTYTLAFYATSATDQGAKFACQICGDQSLKINSQYCDSITVNTKGHDQHLYLLLLLLLLIPLLAGVITFLLCCNKPTAKSCCNKDIKEPGNKSNCCYKCCYKFWNCANCCKPPYKKCSLGK